MVSSVMQRFQRYFDRFASENCLVCIHFMSLRFLLAPLTGHCKHSKSHYCKFQHFTVARFNICMYAILSFMLAGNVVMLLNMISRCSKTLDEPLCISILNNVVHNCFDLSAMCLLIINKKPFVDGINAMCLLLGNCKIGVVLPHGLCRRFTVNQFIVRICLHLYQSISLGMGIFIFYQSYAGVIVFASKLVTAVGFYMQLMLIFSYCSSLRIYRMISNGAFARLMEAFQKRGENTLNTPLVKVIRYHVNFILISRKILKFLSINLSRVTMLWIMESTCHLITCFYVLIIGVSQAFNWTGFAHLCMLVLFQIVMQIYWIAHTDMENLNDDMLSFLFRYPISKLSHEERSQVELLIKTLSLQKPQVKASDAIPINKKLLASISGTVLTYVLVALQFREAGQQIVQTDVKLAKG